MTLAKQPKNSSGDKEYSSEEDEGGGPPLPPQEVYLILKKTIYYAPLFQKDPINIPASEHTEYKQILPASAISTTSVNGKEFLTVPGETLLRAKAHAIRSMGNPFTVPWETLLLSHGKLFYGLMGNYFTDP